MTAYQKSWRKALLKDRNDKICRLRAEGMSLTILSKRFGLSNNSVKDILKEAGLWTRKQG